MCVDNLHSSAVGVATYSRLDGKFHTRTCGRLDRQNQAKTLAIVSVVMFLVKIFSVSTND